MGDKDAAEIALVEGTSVHNFVWGFSCQGLASSLVSSQIVLSLLLC